ncbi:MAG TPA: methyl-accepting chemotaxis protein [Porticoccaceae bacterium]|nr:methyl-accepting chemotaxis protein [Porticoccaceae bacterium]
MNFLLNKITIKARLIIGFALLLAVALASAGIGYRMLESVVGNIRKTNEIGNISLTIADARAEEKNYILGGDEDAIPEVTDLLDTAREDIRVIRETYPAPEIQELMDEFLALIDRYQTEFERYVEIDEQNKAQVEAMESAGEEGSQAVTLARDDKLEALRKLLADGGSTEAAAVGASETGIANHIIDWLLQARIDEKSYLADPAPNRAELIKSSLANIDEEALTLKKNSKDPASGELADLVIAQNAIYRAAFEKYVTGAAEQIAIRGRLADLAAEVDALSASSSASQRQQLHNESATAEILLLISAAVATGVSILLAGVMVWFIVKPLQRVIAAMRDVAEGEGDLTRRLPAEGRDELSQLGRAFNAFSEKMRAVIGQVAEDVHHLSEAGQQLEAASSQSAEAIDRQRGETELVATAMVQMVATVQEVSANVAQTAGAADEADAQAGDGRRVVERTIHQINALGEQIEHVSTTIAGLEQDSAAIGAVLNIIRGVAEQTNLLALNAAIEAARAGEHGRGFAVVADEVRSLAHRTRQSTEEIKSTIEKLQVATRQAVEVMDRSREQSRAAVDHAAQSGEALSFIAQAVGRINDMSTQISAAAEQQHRTAEEVNRNVVSIADLASQTAGGAEQTTAASREVARRVMELRNVVAQFKI